MTDTILAAGLYDASDNLVASWETLVNTYGMDCEKNYVKATSTSDKNYTTNEASPYYVLTNHSELTAGVKMIIADGVTRIGDYAFHSCTNLISISISDSVTSIGNSAFGECAYLTSVTLGNSVTSIEALAFSECYILTSIEIPDSVTTIGDYAFYHTNITSITIPDGITEIRTFTFADCYYLESITIPNSVTKIRSCAFSGCEWLEDVYYDGTEEEWAAINIADRNDELTSANIHCLATVASVTYKGEKIVYLSGGRYVTLHTAGKRMEDDIRVEVAEVTTESSDPVLQEKTITENGEYTPDSGYDGLSKVNVKVPNVIPDGYILPSGTKSITENGTHDVTEYENVTVDVTAETYNGLFEDRPTLKGTWLFNDVLTNPYEGSSLSETVAFTMTTFPPSFGVEIEFSCNEMVVTPALDFGYYVTSSSIDISAAGFTLPYTFYMYTGNTWQSVVFGEGIKTITFTGEQYVSRTFYEWFIANAVPQEAPTASITYNGVQLVSFERGKQVTLLTNGKQMDGDLVITFG